MNVIIWESNNLNHCTEVWVSLTTQLQKKLLRVR